jgi:hypothetical protein
MFRRFADNVGRFLKNFLEDFYGGPMHRLAKMAEKKSQEDLNFTADAERGRAADFRQHPTKIVPPTPKRSAAEERRRIDDRPVP